MKMQKALSFLLTLVLILSMFASCTEPDDPGHVEVPTGETPTLQEVGEINYPVESNGKKLTIWCPIQPAAARHMTSYNEHEIFIEISKRTGIEVEFIHPAVGQEREQLGLLMAGDELPDIIVIRGLYNGGSAGGVDDGAFLDMTDLMAEYAPDYYKTITSSAEVYRLATSNDGRITEFQLIKQSAPEFDRVNILSSVAQQYGITEAPVTIEDYEEMFAKMAADGMAGFAPAMNGRVNQFMWPYGISSGYFLDEDGNVKFGPYTQEYKEYLTMMNDWYNKGYLYKDFVSNLSASQRMNLFLNKQVGMMINSVDNTYVAATAKGDNLLVANYPRLYEGQEIPFATVSWDTIPVNGEPQTTVISATSENKELAMMYLNYFYTQEGADLCNWGIEGKHYTVDENGQKSYTDYVLNNPDVPLADANATLKLHLWAKLSEPDVVCNPNVISREESLALRMLYSDDTTVNSTQHIPDFKMSTIGSANRADLQTDIQTYVDEMTIKFITGVTPLSEFDVYLETLKSLSVEEAIEITQAEYDAYLIKAVPEGLE